MLSHHFDSVLDDFALRGAVLLDAFLTFIFAFRIRFLIPGAVEFEFACSWIISTAVGMATVQGIRASLSAATFSSPLMWCTVNRKGCSASSHFATRLVELREELKIAEGAGW